MEYVRVGAAAEIPEGEVRAFDTAAGRVAVAQIEQRLYAFGDECTHMGCSLTEGGTLDDRSATIECDCHNSLFDVETGEPVEGPAVDPVPVFAVREADGWVEVATQPNTG